MCCPIVISIQFCHYPIDTQPIYEVLVHSTLFLTLVFFLDRLTNECEALKKQIRELNTVIEEPFQGSEEELKLLISNFQRDQDKKKRELQDVRIFNALSIKQNHRSLSL